MQVHFLQTGQHCSRSVTSISRTTVSMVGSLALAQPVYIPSLQALTHVPLALEAAQILTCQTQQGRPLCLHLLPETCSTHACVRRGHTCPFAQPVYIPSLQALTHVPLALEAAAQILTCQTQQGRPLCLHFLPETCSTHACVRRGHTCPFVGAHQQQPRALDARMLFYVYRHLAFSVGHDQDHQVPGEAK
jgi:hypothetical protein